MAQLYFWTWRDREGFAQALDGITLLGIDNDLGVRDPMVDCFLNNIMRADDAEIQRFYDLLGYAITQARALKGDEEYLAFLCNARLMMTKLCSFLTPMDDLAEIVRRVAEIKQNLHRHARRTPCTNNTHGKRLTLTYETGMPGKHSTNESTPTVLTGYEDRMMQVDVDMKRDGMASLPEDLFAVLTKTDIAPLSYDGTTLQNAVRIAATLVSGTRKGRTHEAAPVTDKQRIVRDTSMRAEAAAWLVYCESATQGCVNVAEDLKTYAVPDAHPAIINGLEHVITALQEQHVTADCERVIRTRIECMPVLSARMISYWTELAPPSDLAERFRRVLFGLRYCPEIIQRACLVGNLMSACIWAREQDLALARSVGPRAVLVGVLGDASVAAHYLREFQNMLLWAGRFCEYELQIRQLHAMGDWAGVTNLFSAYEDIDFITPPFALIAEAYYRLGATSDAARLTHAAISSVVPAAHAERLRAEITPDVLSAVYQEKPRMSTTSYQDSINRLMKRLSAASITNQ